MPETKVPEINPFSRMGLKTRSPGQILRETPTATWDELTAFRGAAKELGYNSVGTAAFLTWEWLQREEHVFGAFDVSHYRPKERPNSVKIVLSRKRAISPNISCPYPSDDGRRSAAGCRRAPAEA